MRGSALAVDGAVGTAGSGATGRESQRGALSAGLGLLAMSVLAGVSNTVLGQLVVPGDAARTAIGIAGHEQQFRLVVTGLLAVAVLDVVVAWGLYLFLAQVSRSVALLGAWLRLLYAALFVAASGELLAVPRLLDGETGVPRPDGRVLDAVTSYQDRWTVALAVFGLHLLVVGWLVLRSPSAPSWLGALVMVAGLGYAVDGAGVVLVAGYDLRISLVTFVGEVLLMFWLLWRGRRPGVPHTQLRLQEEAKVHPEADVGAQPCS